MGSIRTLRRGMTGHDVALVQRALNMRQPLLARLHINGEFDKKTWEAVCALQARTGCTPSGMIDGECRSVLFPLVTATTTISMRMRLPIKGPATAEPPRAFSKKAHLLPPFPPMPRPPMPHPPIPPPWPNYPSPHPPDWPLEPLAVPNLPNLPVPRIPNLGKYKFDSVQAQTGSTINIPPLDAMGSSVIVMQSVWVRKREHSDYQQQITNGVQVQGPLTLPSDDGKNWTISAFTQYTWADPFWRRGSLHLVQPFAQFSGQYDVAHRAGGASLGLYPINLGLDLVDDGAVALYVQGGAVGTLAWQNNRWQATLGPNLGFGLTIKLPQ
jgi:hypothetical protein